MSIDDDFFEVEAALEGKPEQAKFNRIWKRLCALEKFEEETLTWMIAMERGAHFRRRIERGDFRQLMKD